MYDRLQPGFRGRCTAPLLVDRAARRAVCNESSDIVRSLNDLQLPGCTHVDLRPPHLEAEIDSLNARVGCVNCYLDAHTHYKEAAQPGQTNRITYAVHGPAGGCAMLSYFTASARYPAAVVAAAPTLAPTPLNPTGWFGSGPAASLLARCTSQRSCKYPLPMRLLCQPTLYSCRRQRFRDSPMPYTASTRFTHTPCPHTPQIYASINNGVYRSGFATSQAAYDAVQDELWAAMDDMERRLSSSRFLLGDRCGACSGVRWEGTRASKIHTSSVRCALSGQGTRHLFALLVALPSVTSDSAVRGLSHPSLLTNLMLRRLTESDVWLLPTVLRLVSAVTEQGALRELQVAVGLSDACVPFPYGANHGPVI